LRKASAKMMRRETEKIRAPSDFELSEVVAINPGKKPVVKITGRDGARLPSKKTPNAIIQPD